jgi:hypothetical protein
LRPKNPHGTRQKPKLKLMADADLEKPFLLLPIAACSAIP